MKKPFTLLIAGIILVSSLVACSSAQSGNLGEKPCHNKSGQSLSALVSNGKPSVIIFGSKMCQDCLKVKPIMQKLEEEYGQKINFINIDIRSKEAITKEAVKKYRVFGVPTVIFVDKKGKNKKELIGYNEEKKYKAQLEALLGK
jgi:thioredoxin 1